MQGYGNYGAVPKTPLLVYNVGDISSYVRQELHAYRNKQKIKDTVALPPGYKFSEYVVWQWYIFAMDHVFSIRTRTAKGWCRPDEEITRFALRVTQPEMDRLYRVVTLPENIWRLNDDPTLILENKERDLFLQYQPNNRR